MARTSVTAVKQLLSTGEDYDVERAPSLQPFVDTAASLVNRLVVCATRKTLAVSPEDLELIERWLAAHSYCLADPIYQSKSVGGASGQFQGQSGMGLEQTRYGQQALLLDWTGCLAAISKGNRAGGFWGGKTRSEALDFEERN